MSGTAADLTQSGRGAGYKWFDQCYDVEILRLTDANTHVDDGSGLSNRSFSTMSGAGHSSFSKDGDMVMGLNSFGNALLWDYDYATNTATRITPLTGDNTRPIDLKNEPWFSLVTNKLIYGVDTRSGHNNNLKVTQLNLATGTYTVQLDLSTLGITFSGDSNAHEGAHTAGVTSSDDDPDEYLGCYWGGSSGDYDRYYSIWKKSDPANVKTLDCQLKRVKIGAGGSWSNVTATPLNSTFRAATTISVSGTTVTGGGTASFLADEIVVGQKITLTTSAGSETREITAIGSSTSMTVASAFAGTATSVAGTSVTIEGTRIHSAQMDRSGRYILIYKSLRTNPVGSIVAIWDTSNDTFQLANNETGHAVNGFGNWINNSGNTSPMQWRYRLLSDVSTSGTQRLLVGGEEAHPGVQFNIAEHPAWLNASKSTHLPPFISGIYRYGQDNEDTTTRPWRFWHDEIVAVQTDAAAASATVWRIVHHMSDLKGDTGGATAFGYAPRVQVNRQGTVITWTSNMDKSLGSCTGCDPGQSFRGDIFLAKLPVTSPAVADASSISVGTITDTSAVVSFSLSNKGDAIVEYGLSTSYGSSAKDYIMKSGSRAVTLTGLTAGTQYFVRASSRNRAGVTGTTVTSSFTTTGAGASDFVTDTFTEASDVTLASHVGEAGATWTKHPAAAYASASVTVDAATDRIYASGTTAYYASGSPPSANYYVEGVFFAASLTATNAAICVRMDTTADTMYLLRLTDGTAWTLRKIVAGTATTLATSTSNLPTAGQSKTVRLVVSGSSLTVFIEGVQDNNLSVTDTSITGAGKAGVRFVGAATSTTGFHLASVNAR